MKTTILISLLCLASMSGFAQFQYTTKDHPPLKEGAKPIPVTPAFDGQFTVVTDTPCYMYKRHGMYIVNCPGVWFPPEKRSDETALDENIPVTKDITVQGERSYSGYYPKGAVLDPSAPANAVPAWPTTPYVSLVPDGVAPCYRYVNKRGLSIMECHGAQFTDENKK